jgi:hypothetical protein
MDQKLDQNFRRVRCIEARIGGSIEYDQEKYFFNRAIGRVITRHCEKRAGGKVKVLGLWKLNLRRLCLTYNATRKAHVYAHPSG